MKSVITFLTLVCCFSSNAQFQLFDFDTKTNDISKLKYTEYSRLLADKAGNYYEQNEVVFPTDPKIRTLTFDKNGYLTSRVTNLENTSFTYAGDYTSALQKDQANNKTHSNKLVRVGNRIVFVSDTETGTIERDAQNRVVKIPNTKYPSQDITISYDSNSYTINNSFSKRTFNDKEKEVLSTFSSSSYQYYNTNGAVEFTIELSYSYVSGYNFYVYEYDAKGNWITRALFHYMTGFNNKEWRLNEITYREIFYENGAVSKPTIQIASDRTKYMALATTLPTVNYNPKENGYSAYIGKTDLLNLKTTKIDPAPIEKNKTVTSNCAAGDCQDGLGKKTIDKSTVYGIFSKGRLNTIGIQEYSSGKYEGEFQNEKRNGYGIYTWNETKQTHIGIWKNGFQDGYGIVMEGDKIIQAGMYEAGKLKTNFLNPYNAGTKTGDCTGDCVNGFGKYEFANGDWYMGFFNNGQFYKLGVYFFKNSNSNYWGTYENNKMHGAGHYYTSEYTYIGDFENGNMNGKGLKKFTSGTMEAGRYENGSRVISYGILK
ncbi:MAG: hypothetical protein R3359_06870 [Marinirhabdus sp.]|nr:hypothetical protein [Marinirhabdus sp.]